MITSTFPSGSTIVTADSLTHLRTMPDSSVQMCVTSPPYYGLRDYGVVGQLGLEPTPDEYVRSMVDVFREVNRVLKDDGTLWLNIGDSYAGNGSKRSDTRSGLTTRKTGALVGTDRDIIVSETLPVMPRVEGLKTKDLIGIPWLLAFALRADGWYLRQDIIWHKPNPMPESVTDRCTKAHEYMFLLSKSKQYYFNHEAIKEPAVSGPHIRNRLSNFKKVGNVGNHHQGADMIVCDGTRNRRSVWTVNSKPYKGAHFATFPPALITPCILAGSRVGDVVLDPFFGAGTTGVVCAELQRHSYGIELNPTYADLAATRIADAMASTKDAENKSPTEDIDT